MLLEEFQARFIDSLRSPKKLEWIQGEDPRERLTKLQVYARGARLRFQKTLEEDYPLCREILGEKVFTHLSKVYVDLFPSQVTSLNEYSRNFPRLMDQTFGAHSWQAHLAAFEWNLLEVHYGRGPSGVMAGSFRELKIHSPLKLLSSEWSLAKTYRDRRLPRKEAEVLHFIFYMSGSKSFFETLELWQAQVIHDLLTTKSLDLALELLAHDVPSIRSDQVKHFFKLWAERGVFEIP